MAKQAKRRKSQQQKKAFRMPRIPFARIVTVLGVIGALALTYQFSTAMLDRPIRSVQVNGPFQRVSAMQIEAAFNGELSRGFLSADLTAIQNDVISLPWIDYANVSRRWPGRIVISVTEQVPAACWGERGLLNTRGELFVTDASHVPAELPRLRGPEDQSSAVARRYLEVRDQLIPLGLDVRELELDERGAWDMTLTNGIEVRLGRRDVSQRTELFLDVVANIVSSRDTEIDYVDMRYGNGFSIGWKNGSRSPVKDPEDAQRELLAERIN